MRSYSYYFCVEFLQEHDSMTTVSRTVDVFCPEKAALLQTHVRVINTWNFTCVLPS